MLIFRGLFHQKLSQSIQFTHFPKCRLILSSIPGRPMRCILPSANQPWSRAAPISSGASYTLLSAIISNFELFPSSIDYDLVNLTPLLGKSHHIYHKVRIICPVVLCRIRFLFYSDSGSLTYWNRYSWNRFRNWSPKESKKNRFSIHNSSFWRMTKWTDSLFWGIDTALTKLHEFSVRLVMTLCYSWMALHLCNSRIQYAYN